MVSEDHHSLVTELDLAFGLTERVVLPETPQSEDLGVALVKDLEVLEVEVDDLRHLLHAELEHLEDVTVEEVDECPAVENFLTLFLPLEGLDDVLQ